VILFVSVCIVLSVSAQYCDWEKSFCFLLLTKAVSLILDGDQCAVNSLTTNSSSRGMNNKMTRKRKTFLQICPPIEGFVHVCLTKNVE